MSNHLIYDVYDHKWQSLSDEVYEILVDDDDFKPSDNYGKGARVRLISGVQDSKDPGYHFEPDWVTVCSVCAPHAEYAGFQRKDIRRVEQMVLE